jgi:hypothetical protein
VRAWVAWGLALALVPGVAGAQVSMADPVALASSLAGRVCADQDGDGRCGEGEPGVAGIRLVLATGREVRTDAQGRYHLTGVDARSPEVTGGVHLRPGRHRLKVDLRTVPAGGQVSPEAVTVEVPWGAAVLQDFVVHLRQESVGALALSHSRAPPQAEVREGGVSFTAAGQATPGDDVRVAGRPAQVDAAGLYRAEVALRPGANVLDIVALSPGGSVRLFRQRADVVKQGEGRWLIVPRALESLGQVRLPARRGEPVPSGTVSLHVEAAEGTRLRLPGGEWEVGPQGSVEVPLTLVPGPNAVALQGARPGADPWTYTVELVATARPFIVGLLDLEGSYSPGDERFQLLGRGAAHAEARLGAFQLLGEVDLRDTDFRTLHDGDTSSGWLRPRLPERLERSPDPELSLEEWGDDSVSLTPNAPEGRLRLELQHDTHGRAGFGTYRALLAEGEIGRYHHPLFGPFAELKAGTGSLRVGVDAFAGGMSDPVRGVATRPAHEELRATGGSLYFLGAAAIVEGSELLRVEYRDGLTGLPLAERHLVRGRDYELDAFSGRILLARPLSFLAGASAFGTDALTAAPEPVLVADYAAVEFAGARDAVGGEAWAEWLGARLTLGGVRERRLGAPYQLLSGRAQGTLGAYALQAEVAGSSGWAVGSNLFGVSDDGGLSYLRPALDGEEDGEALGLRVQGPGPLGGGSVDAAFRWRSQGFSDGAHVESALFRQLSLRASQPLGAFRLTLLGDDRRSADPRQPFEAGRIAARTLGAGLGYERGPWGVRLEVRDSWLRAPEVAGEGPVLEGGRTSVGLQGQLRVHERVVLSAGHRQALLERGEGPGRLDDTFASAGVDVTLDADTTVGLRGGWGPELGPQVWANAAMHRGPDVFYGGYSVDVDGPDFGVGRAVTGASTELRDGTSVFVEDISSHDTRAVRLARAVGFQQTVFGGFQVGGRYERGLRHPFELPSSFKRDTASLFGQWVYERFRVEGRTELRHERGVPVRGPQVAVDRVQTLVALAAETLLREDLTLSGRVNFARTGGADGLRGRLVEGSSGVAWRPGPWLLVARYSITREQVPGERAAFGERILQVISLVPAVRVGDRFAVAAGAHLGRSRLGSEAAWVGTGTLRPSVRVVGGLEVGAEVARRTSAREGESLSSVRGELGYQVDAGLRFAAGYTVLGFKGLGLSGESQDDADRFYVRAEVAY